MESEPANTTASAPNNSAKPRSHIKLIAVVAVAAILLVVGGLLVSSILTKPQGQDAWLFKGAYAKYEGSTSMTVMGFDVSVSFTVRQEVVDFNNTHAQVTTSFRMSSSVGESVEDENTTWVPLSQASFINAFDAGNFTESYEATVNIPGIGTRTCTVYEFEISDEGLTMTVYVDKAIGWPLKMTVSMTGENLMNLQLDINLTETNIPGLK
ncbi:MAG: hypothetical protein NWE99_01795 [Candidatus Bathyarchaeota archaeon]|nr:hypothetical protein [Candidatus Bathyarchaeota archaeon]